MNWPWTKSNAQVEDKVQKLEFQIVEQKENFEAKLQVAEDLTIKAAKSAFENVIRSFNFQVQPNYQSLLQLKSYQRSPSIFAVVSRIANAAAAIPFYPENLDGSEVNEKDKIYSFLSKLTLEKRVEAYSYYLLKGEIFGYKEKVEFGVNAGVINITFLHPDNVDVLVTPTFPVQIAGFLYWDNIIGEKLFIDIEDMLFIKNFNPDTDVYQRVRGLPPPKVLEKILARDEAGVDTSVAQMQNGGLPGIVYDKTPGIQQTGSTGEVSVIGQRKENFARFLNNKANKNAPYFSSGDMGYIAIGSTNVDLDLINLSAENLDMVCNVYHTSSTEFNNKDASTESNVMSHRKSFTTNAVLPIVSMFRDGLNLQVIPDIATKAILMEDISDITELQPDQKNIADAAAAQPVFIPNDIFEKLGYKRIEDDENMNKVFIKSGYQLIDELVTPVDNIPNVAQDYNVPAK